jgi:amino acid transporter
VFLITLSLSLTYMNYRGLHVVGNAVVTGTLFILVPFIVLSFACIPHTEPRNWVKVGRGAYVLESGCCAAVLLVPLQPPASSA